VPAAVPERRAVKKSVCLSKTRRFEFVGIAAPDGRFRLAVARAARGSATSPVGRGAASRARGRAGWSVEVSGESLARLSSSMRRRLARLSSSKQRRPPRGSRAAFRTFARNEGEIYLGVRSRGVPRPP
jgi:hypothetical protein